MKKTENDKEVLLNKKAINEIIAYFNEIDERIINLHNYSSEDFLNLNKILKNYYEKIKKVSQNSTNIIDSISGKNFDEFTSNLNNIQEQLNNPLNGLEEKINIRTDAFEKILSILDYIIVPLNNLKQNLITFKLVIASVKLNLTFSAGEAKSFADFSQIIEDISNNLKELYIIIETTLKKFKIEIKDTLFNQYHLKDKVISEIKTIKFNLENTISLISVKYKDIFSNVPQISEQVQSCFKNIDQIITNLQYHDIIRQKMNHIQDIQKDIIVDLHNFDPDNQDVFNSKYFTHIPEIAELQVAQLMLTNKEYQTAIEKITTEILEINDNIQNITTVSLHISEECQNSKVNNEKDLISKSSQLEKTLNHFEKENDEYQIKLNNINDYRSNLFSLFTKIDDFEKDLIKLNNFLTNNKSDSDKYSQLLEKTNSLIKAINYNNKEIQKLYNQIQLLFKNLDSDRLEFNEQNTRLLIKQYSGLFNLLISQINEHTGKITNQLNNNIEINIKISQEVKESLKSIKYYDLFEKMIEEIVNKLNEINKMIRSSSVGNGKELVVEDLNKLKQKYTMQSERDIHDQILNKQKEIGIDLEKDYKEEDEGELELF